jgi:hypothetical protein
LAKKSSGLQKEGNAKMREEFFTAGKFIFNFLADFRFHKRTLGPIRFVNLIFVFEKPA